MVDFVIRYIQVLYNRWAAIRAVYELCIYMYTSLVYLCTHTVLQYAHYGHFNTSDTFKCWIFLSSGPGRLRLYTSTAQHGETRASVPQL